MDEREWDERYAGKKLVWSSGPNRLFAELTESLTPGRALDAGCGEGRNAIWLAERGWEVEAVDFSAVAIEKARQIARRRNVQVDFRVGDMRIAALRDGGYDLVAVLYIHTSLKEREIWLPRVASAVAESGRFVYIGHDPSNVDEGVGGPQDGSLLPGCGEVSEYLNGLDILQAEVHRRKVETDPGHGGADNDNDVALDALVVARNKINKKG